MKKRVHFLWETEKRIKITQAGQEGAFFYEVYQQAMAGVTEIVRASVMHTNQSRGEPFFSRDKSEIKDNDDFFPDLKEDKYFYNYPNNMIVFSGERGTGKSSAMLTFVSSLKDPESRLFKSEFLNGMAVCRLPGADPEKIADILKGCKFISLPPIDPTTLEKNDQILIVLLARMFQMAIDAWDEQENNLSSSLAQEQAKRKDDLMGKFSVCYEHVCAIKKLNEKETVYEGLEMLADLGDGSRLKREFADLVDTLLKFQCPNSNKEPYLILQIDDTDMNIENAYSILEDIRKYLVIPRVIITMAADLKHLKKIVEGSLLESYPGKKEKNAEYAGHIAQQYITKLFPQTRQITLPDLGTYLKEHADSIEIWYNTPSEWVLPEEKRNGYKKKKRVRFPDMQEQIFRLIYRKTGMIFLKHKNLLHYIIPENMRLHAHFLSMLVQMEDVEEDPDSEKPHFFIDSKADGVAVERHRGKLRVRLQNILRFRDYFLTTWVTNNLNEEDAGIIGELAAADISKKVRFACTHLWHKCTDGSARKTLPENQCSYADMVRLYRYFEERVLSEEDRRFVFAVQTYFSLLGHSIALEELIEFYDRREGPEDEWTMCSLKRLYPVYGSRIFPYSHWQEPSDQGAVDNGRGQAEGESMYYASLSLTGDNRRFKLPLCWRMEPLKSLEKIPKARGAVGIVYSLFAEYMQGKENDGYLLDLCNLIGNCLYLGKEQQHDADNAMPWGTEKAEAASAKETDWLTMRNSALLTVLNWDVQDRVGQKILDLAQEDKKTGEDNKIAYSDWDALVEKFYTLIVSSFKGDSQSAIHALDELKFFGCLTPLLNVLISETPEVAQTAGWEVLSCLNPYIAIPSKTDSSAEEQQPKKMEQTGTDSSTMAGGVSTPKKTASGSRTKGERAGTGGELENISPVQQTDE